MNIRVNGIKQSFQKLILRLVACIAITFPLAALAAPAVLYTDIDSGPNTGGENNNGAYLSIFGKGFGTSGLGTTVKVYVGNGEVARYMYLGASRGRPDVQQLSVQLGPNASSGAIKVVVNGVSSNIDKTFTVRPGNFYYLAPGGSDSTGRVNDITHPFLTPQYVLDSTAFAAGDFMIVRGGQYPIGGFGNNANSWLRADKSGTAAAPMAFLGYPGEKVEVLHSNAIRIFSNYVSISNWVIGDFLITLTDCVGDGEFFNIGPTTTPQVCADTNYTLFGTATNIKLVNTEANGNDTAGFCSGGDGLVEIQHSQNVKIIGISLHNTSPAQGDNESSHAIYLSSHQQGTEVGWNAVYNIPATRGVIQAHQDSFSGACWGTKQITNITIHDNLLHDLAGQEILLDGGTGDIQVYNNLIYNNLDHRYGDVISSRGGGGKLNAKLYNNTVYVNPQQASQGWILGIGSYMGGYCPESLTLYNNVFVVTEVQDLYYHNDSGQSCARAITSDANLWYGSKNHKTTFEGPHELYTDPKFVNPGKGLLWLRRESPAIGKGNPRVSPVVSHDYDMNPRGDRQGYDIGAYQYQPPHD